MMATMSVAAKLQIKPNTTLWTASSEQLALLGPLPEGVQTVPRMDEAATALVFGADAAGIRKALDLNKDWLAAPRVFWIAYPKGNRADINRDSLWPILAEYGMRPVSQVAIDEVWSALRFRMLKEGEAPFTAGT
jgi:hypothetical protein